MIGITPTYKLKPKLQVIYILRHNQTFIIVVDILKKYFKFTQKMLYNKLCLKLWPILKVLLFMALTPGSIK